MNEGKRRIGEYTVLCSVNVGEKEVILAFVMQSLIRTAAKKGGKRYGSKQGRVG